MRIIHYVTKITNSVFFCFALAVLAGFLTFSVVTAVGANTTKPKGSPEMMAVKGEDLAAQPQSEDAVSMKAQQIKTLLTLNLLEEVYRMTAPTILTSGDVAPLTPEMTAKREVIRDMIGWHRVQLHNLGTQIYSDKQLAGKLLAAPETAWEVVRE